MNPVSSSPTSFSHSSPLRGMQPAAAAPLRFGQTEPSKDTFQESDKKPGKRSFSPFTWVRNLWQRFRNWVGSLLNRSDRKKAEQQAKDQTREKEMMASGKNFREKVNKNMDEYELPDRATDGLTIAALASSNNAGSGKKAGTDAASEIDAGNIGKNGRKQPDSGNDNFEKPDTDKTAEDIINGDYGWSPKTGSGNSPGDDGVDTFSKMLDQESGTDAADDFDWLDGLLG